MKTNISRIIQRTLCLVALGIGLLYSPTTKAADVNVGGEITGNVTWYSTNLYTITNTIYVLSNAVLNIEPGTVIWSVPGDESDTNNIIFTALFVCQGGKMYAEGTRTRPIIFTAQYDDVNDPNDYTINDTALWGGIVLCGKAVINRPSDTGGNLASPKYDIYEGLADTTASNGQKVHRYGGNDDADNSGVMRYVSIRHGGQNIKVDKELNGLSLCCVGSNTIIEHVEVIANDDDGFEFFGGTVNTKYLVSAFCLDEEFDIDQGYRGKSQFWFGIHPKNYAGQFGGEWNGEPNGLATSNTPLAQFTVYNMTLVGSGPDSALRIRDYAAPRVYNSVFTEFKTKGITVGNPGSIFFTNGTIEFRETIWNTNTGPVDLVASNAIFAVTSLSNVFLNPLLTSISYTNDGGLDPRPASGSPALNSSITPPCDGFLTPVSYKGAFDNKDLWLNDWTALDSYGLLPRRTNAVNVGGEITGNVTWYSTNLYTITNTIYVLSNAVLNIEPGTVIWSVPGDESDTNNIIFTALFVCQGGKMYAEGTANNPIIFTAQYDDVNDPNDYTINDTALWGGIVLCGNAVINRPSDTGGNLAPIKYDIYEGLADTTASNGQKVHRYGGNDDADNSGVMRYVSIRHGGQNIKVDKELNGLSLCCVGSNTIIEHVEVIANDDDGFEFFGGTVNTKYLISAFCLDEEFDVDQGYRGKSQFWFGIHPKNYSGQFGGEWNGEPNGLATSNTPLAQFTVYNMTLVGSGPDSALRIRDYAAPRVYNSVFTEFKTKGITVGNPGSIFFTNGTIEFQETIWNTNTGPVDLVASNAIFGVTSLSNVFLNPLLTGISYTNDFGLNPQPQAGSPALNSSLTAPNNGFYTPVAYKGAFDANYNWAVQWTALGEYGVMSGRNGAESVACFASAVPTPNPVTVHITQVGANAIITCDSQVGYSYTLESTGTLPGGWSPAVGVTPSNPQAGTGGTLTFTIPLSGASYFRVFAQ